MNLAFSEDETTGYYIKIRFDILDDDNYFDCVVRFDDKETALDFKTKFNELNIHGTIMSTSDGIWLKQYHRDLNHLKCELDEQKSFSKFIYAFPELSTKVEDIDFVLSRISNYYNDGCFERLRFSEQNVNAINNYVHIIRQCNYYSDDENELRLYKTKQDRDMIIMERNEYEATKILAKRITANFDLTVDYFLASTIDRCLFKEKFVDCSVVHKLSVYDIAAKKLDQLYDIFYADPLNFTENNEVKKFFDQESIDLMKFEICKLKEDGLLDKPIKKYHDLKGVGYFTNNHIYKRYIDYLNELLEQEKNGLL